MSGKSFKGRLFLFVFSLTLVFLLLSLGCKTVPTEIKSGEKSAAANFSALSENDLENAEYHSLSAQKSAVKLHRGVFRKNNPGRSKSETITALSHYIAYGKLPDQRDSAAAVLITMTGGTGVFHDLAVVAKRGGRPKNIATIYLGDRIQIKSLSIKDGYILVDMIKHKKKDPMCCPSQEVMQKYELQGNKLALVKTREK
jgi:hypothetical protein